MNGAPKVLIVGAGPTGLTVAQELARDGIPCRIIDKSPHATTHSKAIAIHARTLEPLR
jgi:2-polyprenyl-6-methoxyphenol hydroxylase-like FAD-dependent oxidoreductase